MLVQQRECTVRKGPSAMDLHSQGAAQVSMKLRLAQMWDHNGTNMEALGFMYRNYQVLIALDADDSVKGDGLHQHQCVLAGAMLDQKHLRCCSCANAERLWPAVPGISFSSARNLL